MTNAEVRTKIGEARTAESRAIKEIASLDTRIAGALASERLDQSYVDNLREQKARQVRELANAQARIEALTPQLPTASETSAARTEALALAERAEIARTAFVAAWARLLPLVAAAVESALAVNAAKTTILQASTRLNELRSEYGLSVPRIAEPSMPATAEMNVVQKSADVLRDIGIRQMTDDRPLRGALDALKEQVAG
jgi:hypothetical protein